MRFTEGPSAARWGRRAHFVRSAPVSAGVGPLVMNTFAARFPDLASSLAAELEVAGNRALADELRAATVRATSLDQGNDVAYISLEPLRQLSDVERSIIGERYGRIVPAGGNGAIYLDLDNSGRIVGVQIFSPMPELQAAIRADV
jgi:uncharacterized protein YuzE